MASETRPSARAQPHYPERRYKYDQHRPSARRRGYSKRWERAAKAFLQAHPLCVNRGQPDCKTFAKHVDHIEPHNDNRSKFWNKKNWQPLCHSCHSRKTKLETAQNNTTKGCDADGQPLAPDHPWNAT